MTTKLEIIETLEVIKGGKVSNVDFENETFQFGKSIYSFELTKTGLVKSRSVKFFSTVNNFSNCSY